MPATATPLDPVAQALHHLESAGTIVVSCSREDLLCLLARQILEKTAVQSIARRGRIERIIPIREDLDQVRALAELVLLYFD